MTVARQILRPARSAIRPAPRGMVLIAIGLVAILNAAACRKSSPRDLDACKVIELAGEVSETGADGNKSGHAGDELHPGDHLATSKGSARLLLPDTREIDLGAETAIRIERNGEGHLTVVLERGAIVWRTGHDQAPAAVDAPQILVDVLTPLGITRIAKSGSQATISIANDAVHINVSVGEIAFRDQTGRESIVSGGRSIDVRVGQVQVTDTPAIKVIALPRMDVVISAATGELYTRHADETRFSSRLAEPALAGTAFRVSARGRAQIASEGMRIRLGPGSEGEIGEATHDAHGRRFALALAKGESLVAVEGGAHQRLELGAADGKGVPIVVHTQDAATFSIRRSGSETSIDPVQGNLEIERGDEHTVIGPGKSAVIVGAGVDVAARREPEVTLPTTNLLQVHADGLRDVTLTWPAQFAGARIEVATDPQFHDALFAGVVSGHDLRVPVTGVTNLYWRVSLSGSDPTSAETGVLLGHARFSPDRHRSVLDLDNPHNLVSETPGETTTVYFQSVPPALTFVVPARPNATQYRVRVYREEARTSPVVECVVVSTKCPIGAGILTEGQYLWQAATLDEAGKVTEGGRMNRLELVYDNSLTELAIGTPRPMARVTGSVIEVAGLAPLGARLYVNGRPATLDNKGRFALRMPRAAAYIFRMVGNGGRESYWVRRVRLGT